ncbi:MAG: SgcJ/EcaC family oxidoreductase [Gemmatimonadaceae bacterium]
MTNPTGPASTDDAGVRELYRRLLEAWDKRNARDFALLFAPDGNLVGFDGTRKFGQLEIGAHVSEIFTRHQTPKYIAIVREVRTIAPDVAILSAITGLVPPDKDDIDPDLNAVQTMVAVKKGDGWKIALFQNTPAALHERPDEAKKLSEDLRVALKSPH